MRTNVDAEGEGETVTKETRIEGSDQSVENNPDQSRVKYEVHDADQSNENTPSGAHIVHEKQVQSLLACHECLSSVAFSHFTHTLVRRREISPRRTHRAGPISSLRSRYASCQL
jgi:hypothetical protein